jgi:integrase
VTFETVVDDFIRLYAQPKQRTWKQTESTLKGTCRLWLKRPINDITRSDAYKLFDGFIAEGRVYKAAVALAWCRKLWRWAWQREIVAAPLMDGVKLDFQRRERTRVYSDADIQAIWRAADQLDAIRGGYVKLLLILAPRKRELLRMKWSDIKDGIWTTPFEDTKSKKTAKPRTYLTPLPALANRLLAGITTRDKEDGVFWTLASRPEASLISDLKKHGAPHFGFHVCRHTVATWMQTHGHSLYEASLVLNHSGSGVTAGYSHGYPIELKRKLLEEWSSHVANLVQPAEGVMLLR